MDRHLDQSYGKANTLTMAYWHNLTVLLLPRCKEGFGPLRDWRRQAAHKGSPGPASLY